MIKEYIKKPIKIKAIQYNGNNWDECSKFICSNKGEIKIKDGSMKILPGYYIIQNVNGEFYTLEPYIFEENYELCNNYKITIKEFWESKSFLIIHCKTEEQAKVFCKASDKLGYKWNTGRSYLDDTNWRIYENETCYDNACAYQRFKYYKKNCYKIYKFEEVDFNI